MSHLSALYGVVLTAGSVRRAAAEHSADCCAPVKHEAGDTPPGDDSSRCAPVRHDDTMTR